MSFCSENDDDDYPLPSPPEFTFTPSDVRLLINTPDDTLAYAHVSSHALVLASPVWKNFLFPPWSTSTEKVLEHDFSDDDPAALLVLLRIAHLKLKGIEEFAPSKDLLVDLAILCNKYVCGDLLYPWIAGWVDRHCGGKVEVICKRLDQSLRKKMYKPTSTYESQLMMLVGWIFREHPDLTECFAAGASWMLFQSAEFPEFRSIGRCRLRSWVRCVYMLDAEEEANVR
ncbi:uncharacterized protein LY89DRAFT_99541 [Mollisia scopiformis]|uniref:BTB domain-containing protein n=1 Tax=Mollisia scopiformis TaxID=149040 RepID=A0A194X6Y7_MOLSC|nr:uncharacterized protein LY89DRAFT_99541 [Mollisia scopiformis]KUJ15941.1 hypothetical protein LY89DRAFT_99541 [Mollisia scopiformis]